MFLFAFSALSYIIVAVKILILLSKLGHGGAERVALNLATEWRDAGAEVVIAVLSSDRHDSYPIPEGICVVPLNISGHPSSILAILRNNIAPLIKIRRLLRQERPDIAIGVVKVSIIGLALARTNDEIAIGHEHGNQIDDFRGWTGWIWNFMRRFSYARLDAVVVLTPQSVTWLRENTNVRRVVAIPNSIKLPLPDNEPRIKPKDIVPAGKKLLLASGRLHRQKRFDRLLDAFAQISSHHPDWCLVILGEGDLREKLEAQVDQLGLAQRVHLPSFAGNVADWYRFADAFVLTSDFEGFPMVLLEAMAHGCPVVSVDCDTGPRDIIRNGENGLLVHKDDIDALVDGLDKMLSDDALRKRLASKAVEVVKTYSQTHINALWQDFFNNLKQERNIQNKGI